MWLLWARSRYDLGASFSGRAEARALVTRGIYSRIRHPIYVFGLGVCVGLFAFLGRPQLLPILIVTEPVQFIRARREERVLEAAFGEKTRPGRGFDVLRSIAETRRARFTDIGRRADFASLLSRPQSAQLGIGSLGLLR